MLEIIKSLSFWVVGMSMLLTPVTTYAQTEKKDQIVQRGLFESGKFTGSLGYLSGRISDFELDSVGNLDLSKSVKRMRHVLAFNLGVNLFEKVYFRMMFYFNLNKNINAPWNITDYSFVFERANWESNTFSYGYANYTNNRYKGGSHDLWKNVSKGFFFVKYYNRVPDNWIHRMLFDSTASMSYSLNVNYAVRYLTEENTLEGNWLDGKPVFSANMRYVFVRNIFIEASILYYLSQKTKVIYDPDFTYGFGFNTYEHLTIAFTYGNYAINKFPWNEQKIADYNFLDGQFSFLLNYSF